MKRFSDSFGTGRWKRICPPADDSESDTSSDASDETQLDSLDFYRRLYQYGGPSCEQCSLPNLVCRCNVRHSLSSPTNTSSMITPSNHEDRDRTTELSGPSSYLNSVQPSSAGSSYQNFRTRESALPNNSDISVSFRASTSVEHYSLRNEGPSSRYYSSNLSRRRSEFGSSSQETDAGTSGERNETASLRAHISELLNLSRDNSNKRQETSAFTATGLGEGAARASLQPSSSSGSTCNLPEIVNTTCTDGRQASNAVRRVASDPETLRNKELEDFHARLISLIECPVCLEPIVPPVHQCRRGHLVCSKCKSQLTQCPTCRDRMSETRNWAVERMSELLRYPCRNAGSGCQVTVLLTEKQRHETSCPFRHYSCLFRTCSWTGFQPEVVPHLRSVHPLRFLEGPNHCIDVELNSPTLFYTDWAISCFGRIFRLNVFQHIPNSMFYASAYLMGCAGVVSPSSGSSDAGSVSSGESASDYTYTVTVHGTLGRRISFTRQTHPEATRTSQLCHSEDCFSIRGDKMEHFVCEAGKLRLHVELEHVVASTSLATTAGVTSGNQRPTAMETSSEEIPENNDNTATPTSYRSIRSPETVILS